MLHPLTPPSPQAVIAATSRASFASGAAVGAHMRRISRGHVGRCWSYSCRCFFCRLLCFSLSYWPSGGSGRSRGSAGMTTTGAN